MRHISQNQKMISDLFNTTLNLSGIIRSAITNQASVDLSCLWNLSV